MGALTDIKDTQRKLGEIFERFLARRRTRDEDLPSYYRKLCLACEDSGVESYIHPEHPELAYKRPCNHCALGKLVLTAWLKGGGKDGKQEVRPGPYYGMTAPEIHAILARPCAHPPLPVTGQMKLPEPHPTVVE